MNLSDFNLYEYSNTCKLLTSFSSRKHKFIDIMLQPRNSASKPLFSYNVAAY
ncbi:hypothetical protein Scep_027797 [Stephania cephalantha]|uniref:Uncharacterized protein n=1 Tax=Stephania cephalantha TaxID=152367 RepID=A0AAP0EAY4_9MAGN